MTDLRAPECCLVGKRVIVRLPEPRDAQAIAKFFADNTRHLAEFSPAAPEFSDPALWRLRIETHRRQFLEDRECKTFLYEPDDITVIGSATLSQFVRGPFQAAYLGYSIAQSHEGRGLMREALTLLIAYAFEHLHLHRIMANYMPRNTRSSAVLQRLGFAQEGLARNYLLINGVWEDHILTSLSNDQWKPD